jgi:hypothetical protein
VTFRDPDNKEAVLYLEGKRYYPFQKELMRFMFAKRGFKDDGGTLHTDGFDFGSATLLPPEKGDFRKIDGELVARKITLDKNGERLIEILRGEAAEEYRRDTAALGNPVVRNIYDRTKFLFPKLLGDGNATPAEKKNAEEKDKP